MRDETYFYAGAMFDVEVAKRLVEGGRRYPIMPDKSFLGLPRKFQHITDADLLNPVIFALFVDPNGAGSGVVMIDGNRRMRYALKTKQPILAQFLSPPEVTLVCPGWYTVFGTPMWAEMRSNALKLKSTLTQFVESCPD